MIWKSVVGKLWATILLLVSVVLFILSLLLMQSFRNYIVDDVTNSLTFTATKISNVLEQNKNNLEHGLEMIQYFTDDMTAAIVILDKKTIYHSDAAGAQYFKFSFFEEDPDFSRTILDNTKVKKEISLPEKDVNAIMVGVPFHRNGDDGAVFLYQSLKVMNEATIDTTKIIWLGVFTSFILTTFFAFFLSTRISAPIKKMRQVAFEVVKGKFDTKVPIITNDEIGELAIAINEMRKRLKVNMNDLNKEKELLSNILKSMADGVLTFNRDGKILASNPPAEEFLKLYSHEKQGMVPADLFKLFTKVVETEKEQISDLATENRYWAVIVSPLYDNSMIRGAVAVLRDMTEERNLEKIREDFVANISHELRTPIAMLQGYSEALLDDVASDEQQRRDIATVINEESLRMGRLVNELLDLAKMESGHLSMEMKDVEAAPFIERVVKKFSAYAKENQVQLSLDIRGNGMISMDADRMEQVLTNLIDNAIRHTNKGGQIQVKAEVDESGLSLRVIDNGSGIPKEDLPFIFERFYKADKARTRGESGTGLGLAIAQNIILAHNGKIQAESTLGKGTTFILWIPSK